MDNNNNYKIKMVQQIVYTDEKENKKVVTFAVKWKMSKADVIKKMIREFKEEDENNSN